VELLPCESSSQAEKYGARHQFRSTGRLQIMANILTVDDSPGIRQMIKMMLAPAGHTVIEAGDGAQGLEKAKADRPDLVITDLKMPVMNGLELIRALRTVPAFLGLPIVFVTSESSDAVRLEAEQAGAAGWIIKPFRRQQLLDVVSELVPS
jgi:two-component system chemotaxis response regulator CheY